MDPQNLQLIHIIQKLNWKRNYFYKGNATIGKCLFGVKYKLLNANKSKDKTVGELALSGKQLMEGYINSRENPIG